MKNYKVTYIAIAGFEREATIEAESLIDARKIFAKTCYSYLLILDIEEI